MEIKNFYKKRKKDYLDKVIDSSRGKIYIGIAKRPLMKNDKFNYGYKGVVIQDENRQKIMCNSCGKWFFQLTNFHLKTCCGMSREEYKEEAGLCKKTGLVSDEQSLQLTENALKGIEKARANIIRYNREYKNKHGVHPHYDQGTKNTVQRQNETGTCPDQLKEKLYEFIRCNRELPNCHNRGRAIYRALYRRYGGLGKAFKHLGLPSFNRIGTNYIFQFSDKSVHSFNINRLGDREKLYDMLMKKCLVLYERAKF